MPSNPYPARIEELHEHLARRYAHRDREATEILLAALLDPRVTQLRRPGFIIETDYPSRDTEGAWFTFGGMAHVRSLASARVARLGVLERIINAWLTDIETGSVSLFVDAEWRRLVRLNTGRAHPSTLVCSWGILLARCMRLRVEYPKGLTMLGLSAAHEAHEAELRRLTRRVLDNDLRTEQPRQPELPAGAAYWCELLQKVSAQQTDWDTIVRTIAAVAYARCTLYNDRSMEPGWQAAERVLRDTVNHTTAYILRTAMERKEIHRWDSFEQTGCRMDTAWNEEIAHLTRQGIIKKVLKRRRDRRYKLTHDDWARLTDRDARLFAPVADIQLATH